MTERRIRVKHPVNLEGYTKWLQSDDYKRWQKWEEEQKRLKKLHETLEKELISFARQKPNIVLQAKNGHVLMGQQHIGGLYGKNFVPMPLLAEQLVAGGYLLQPKRSDVYKIEYSFKENSDNINTKAHIIWYKNLSGKRVLAWSRVDTSGTTSINHFIISTEIEDHSLDPTWEMLCVVDALYFRQLGIPLGTRQVIGPISFGFKQSMR